MRLLAHPFQSRKLASIEEVGGGRAYLERIMVVSIRESDYRRLPPQAEEVVRRIVQQTNPYGCAPRGILTFECTDEEWQMIQEKMKVLTNG